MKSNEKYVFSLIYYLRHCLAAEAQNLFEHARRLGSGDYFDVIYSTYRFGLQHGRMEDLWKCRI